MTSSPATSSLLWASSPRRLPRSRSGTSRVGGRNGLGRTGPGREGSPERPLRLGIERADIERAARRGEGWVGVRDGGGRTGRGGEVSPERPLRMGIERADIERAARRIGGLVRKTPGLLVDGGAFGGDGPPTPKLRRRPA